MQKTAKSFIVGLISAITVAFGTVPAHAAEPITEFSTDAAPAAANISQSLSTSNDGITAALDGVTSSEAATLDSVAAGSSAGSTPAGFDVDKAIEAAQSEVGTSRPTGWSAPGECIMSAQRWIRAGGGDWTGGGNPVTNYSNATRLTLSDAQPGDIVQYENIASPTSWVTGVHTLMIKSVNDDGTFDIIQSNVPGGSGLVSEDEEWTPEPPEGFQAVVWRF